MIPKIIHYCWFGRNPLPDIVQKCIESWRNILPNYKILLWNESNVPINEHRFMKEAYDVGMWAFVSDYARYMILFQHGGFFLDCDVEVIKSFDNLCSNQLFFAFQGHVKKDLCFVAPGLIIGSEKEHPYLKRILQRYDRIDFVDSKGFIHYEYASPRVLTKLLLTDTDLKIVNKTQTLSNGIQIYSTEYFDPQNPRAIFSSGLHITNNTYAIHHGAASWVPKRDKIKRFFSILFRRVLGDTVIDKIRGKETI